MGSGPPPPAVMVLRRFDVLGARNKEQEPQIFYSDAVMQTWSCGLVVRMTEFCLLTGIWFWDSKNTEELP